MSARSGPVVSRDWTDGLRSSALSGRVAGQQPRTVPRLAAARKRNASTGLPIVRQGASDYDDRLPVLPGAGPVCTPPGCVFAERRRRPDAGRRVDCRNLRARHRDSALSPAVT